MGRPPRRPANVPVRSGRDISMAKNRACEYVETQCEPGRMTPLQALVYLEQVVEHLQGSIEALRSETENEVHGSQRRASSSKTGAMR